MEGIHSKKEDNHISIYNYKTDIGRPCLIQIWSTAKFTEGLYFSYVTSRQRLTTFHKHAVQCSTHNKLGQASVRHGTKQQQQTAPPWKGCGKTRLPTMRRTLANTTRDVLGNVWPLVIWHPYERQNKLATQDITCVNAISVHVESTGMRSAKVLESHTVFIRQRRKIIPL